MPPSLEIQRIRILIDFRHGRNSVISRGPVQMERSLIAGRKDNIVETYVTLESLGAMLQRVVSQDPSVTEMRVLGFELSNDLRKPKQPHERQRRPVYR